MADSYRTQDSFRAHQSGSQPDYARAMSQARHPSYESERRASASLRNSYGGSVRADSQSALDDLVPVLGMFIGGAVGFIAASMISTVSRPSSGGMAEQSSSFRYGRSTAMDQARSSSVEHDESTDLIASNKVEGTAVYNHKGEHLGEVYNFMVGKRSGRVAYAVMSFGGFLGIGKRYHALPWGVLTYDTNREGYVVNADKDRLMAAPHYAESEDPFSRSENVKRIREFWSAGRLAL